MSCSGGDDESVAPSDNEEDLEDDEEREMGSGGMDSEDDDAEDEPEGACPHAACYSSIVALQVQLGVVVMFSVCHLLLRLIA